MIRQFICNAGKVLVGATLGASMLILIADSFPTMPCFLIWLVLFFIMICWMAKQIQRENEAKDND